MTTIEEQIAFLEGYPGTGSTFLRRPDAWEETRARQLLQALRSGTIDYNTHVAREAVDDMIAHLDRHQWQGQQGEDTRRSAIDTLWGQIESHQRWLVSYRQRLAEHLPSDQAWAAASSAEAAESINDRWDAMARADATRTLRVPYSYLTFQRTRWITLVGRLGFEIAELTRWLDLNTPSQYMFFVHLVSEMGQVAAWTRSRTIEADSVSAGVSGELAKILAFYESNERTGAQLLSTIDPAEPLQTEGVGGQP